MEPAPPPYIFAVVVALPAVIAHPAEATIRVDTCCHATVEPTEVKAYPAPG